MRSLARIGCALAGLCLAPSGAAQQADGAPELDFLEYLGAWAGDDDEWIAIEEWQRDNGADDGTEADEGAERAPPRERNDDEDE